MIGEVTDRMRAFRSLYRIQSLWLRNAFLMVLPRYLGSRVPPGCFQTIL